MNLYRISQNVNEGYDTYDSAVVAAESSDIAKLIHPDGHYQWIDRAWKAQRADLSWYEEGARYGSWTLPENVQVEHIGSAKEGTVEGVIVASFNAG